MRFLTPSNTWCAAKVMMKLVLALLGCYALGSLPTAYLFVQWFKRVDIRTVGSGNVGATNALRTAGVWIGAAVFVMDVLKGVLAAALIPRWEGLPTAPVLPWVCGFAAVVGHDFPCWLRFQGGKGVATTIGALIGSSPLVAALVVGVWLVVFAASRYVSLASLAAAVTIPTSQLALHRSLDETVMGCILATLMVVRHRANLHRLLSGAEHRAWSADKS